MTKIYVGNLGDKGIIKSSDIELLFEPFGAVKVESYKLKAGKFIPASQVDDDRCRAANFAFVHMNDKLAANEAVRILNGSSFNGRTIIVEKAKVNFNMKKNETITLSDPDDTKMKIRTYPHHQRNVVFTAFTAKLTHYINPGGIL